MNIFRTLLTSIALASSILTAAAADTFTVVIDAGHGGKDPGAVNGKSQEKSINLNVALKVGSLIEKGCENVKVLYTRKTDVFVELNKRAEIANKADADLFISIHTNAAKNSSAYGAETYLLGAEENRTSANLSVAMQENQAILLENNYETTYEGYDPSSPESQIIFEFMQNEHQKESLNMATLVQKQLTGYANRHDRGVHQAGFLVLWKNAMPSILVELGYISNQTDRSYLTTSKGVEQLSQSIYRAFKQYLEDTRRQQNENSGARTASAMISNDDRPVFKIQFMASQSLIKENDNRMKSIGNVEWYKDGKAYKYTTGSTNDYDEAVKILENVRKTFKDAFIVAFQGGVRTDLQKAISQSRKNSGN